MSLLSLIKRKRSVDLKNPPTLVLDLDSVLVQTLSFRYDGEDHVIKPIETAEFLKISNIIAQMDQIKSRSDWTSEDTVDMYCGLFELVCPTITKKHVMNMTSTQLLRLYRLVLDCISGHAYKDLSDSDEKKNSETT